MVQKILYSEILNPPLQGDNQTQDSLTSRSHILKGDDLPAGWQHEVPGDPKFLQYLLPLFTPEARTAQLTHTLTDMSHGFLKRYNNSLC